MRKTVCPECDTEFNTSVSRKRYCSSECQIKHNNTKQWGTTKNSPRSRCRSLLNGAKNRTKEKQIPFDLSLDFLEDLWIRQKGVCAVTRLPFNLDPPEKSREPRFDAPSIDRIIPEKGYVVGNVRLVLYQINMAIGPYGLDRLIETVKHIKEIN